MKDSIFARVTWIRQNDRALRRKVIYIIRCAHSTIKIEIAGDKTMAMQNASFEDGQKLKFAFLLRIFNSIGSEMDGGEEERSVSGNFEFGKLGMS